MAEAAWTTDPPEKDGWYWLNAYGTKRVIRVSSYELQGRRRGPFTSDDGGTPITDPFYAGARWYGPIAEPEG